MQLPLIRKAAINDASGIARVHVRSWHVAYCGLMPDEFLDNLDTNERTNMWRDLTQHPDKIIFIAEEVPPIYLAFLRSAHRVTPTRIPRQLR